MNTLKTVLSVALLVAAPFALAVDLTDGEVRKIDRETKKLTLKHAEIKNLDMPPMTMVFLVKDSSMLDGLKPGDKVKFAAEMLGTAMVVTEISVVK